MNMFLGSLEKDDIPAGICRYLKEWVGLALILGFVPEELHHIAKLVNTALEIIKAIGGRYKAIGI